MIWQPIDSAPRDGTWVLLAGGRVEYGWEAEQPPCVVGQWTTESLPKNGKGCWHFAWYDGGYYGEYVKPTNWIPLPDAPAPA